MAAFLEMWSPVPPKVDFLVRISIRNQQEAWPQQSEEPEDGNIRPDGNRRACHEHSVVLCVNSLQRHICCNNLAESACDPGMPGPLRLIFCFRAIRGSICEAMCCKNCLQNSVNSNCEHPLLQKEFLPIILQFERRSYLESSCPKGLPFQNPLFLKGFPSWNPRFSNRDPFQNTLFTRNPSLPRACPLYVLY